MAQSDPLLTDDQEVVGFIPAGSGNILFLAIDHEIFYMVVLSFRWLKKDSYQKIECAKVLVNLED